ncbi:MAG: CPBP family intramembrane metalloprotease [Chloroflexi bacterium]|nr:CPBP family intramembrane metalloprotease [Chloroflexota bacterium]
MPIIIGIFFILGLVMLANFIAMSNRPRLALLFDGLLALINVPILLLGLVLLVVPTDRLASMTANNSLLALDWSAAGWSLVGMGLWGLLVSLRPVRRALGRLLPVDVLSPVHTVALVFSGYLVGNTVFSLTQGGLEELAATAVSASILDILFVQGLFMILAVLGTGLYTRRSAPDVRQRLGLFRPTLKQLITGVGWIFVLVMLQAIGGAVWSLIDSSQAELVEGISSELLGDMDTFAEWLLLAAATGIGEELLFRGALQPVFGLGFTSLLFAFAHVQYGFTPVTLVVFIIGIILGLIRRRQGTAVAIFVHSGYNFTLGMISLLVLRYGDALQ